MLRVRVPSPALRHRLTSTGYSCQQQYLQRFPADLLASPFCQRLPRLCCDFRELVQAAVQAFAPRFPWLLPVGYEVHCPVEVKAILPKHQPHRVAADRCRSTSSGQLSSVAWRLCPPQMKPRFSRSFPTATMFVRPGGRGSRPISQIDQLWRPRVHDRAPPGTNYVAIGVI